METSDKNTQFFSSVLLVLELYSIWDQGNYSQNYFLKQNKTKKSYRHLCGYRTSKGNKIAS